MSIRKENTTSIIFIILSLPFVFLIAYIISGGGTADAQGPSVIDPPATGDEVLAPDGDAPVESTDPIGDTKGPSDGIITGNDVGTGSGSSDNPGAGTAVSPDDISFENCLFIGDSRTVGIRDYSGIEGADFFADVGMSVFKTDSIKVSVGDMGKVTLQELLSQKKYDRIYVMLGINELGYAFNDIVEQYTKLVESITAAQPDATVFVMANMHVAESRSSTDSIYNNSNINRLNNSISELADGDKIFYLDVNPIFDDAGGALDASLTSDGTHIYGKHYPRWAQFLREATAAALS